MTKEVFLRQIKDHIQALSRRPENVLANIGLTQKIYDLYILCDFLDQQEKQAAKQAEIKAREQEELQLQETIVDDSLADPIPVEPTSDRIKQPDDPLNFISTSDFKRKVIERQNTPVYRDTGRPLDIDPSPRIGDQIENKRTVNDQNRIAKIQYSVNDKFAFVEDLFAGSKADFDDAIVQLEQFQHQSEAMFFIENTLKPTYSNWEGKEDTEERFIMAVSQKFV